MGFQASRRYGRYWEDAKKLDELINRYHFNTSGKDERSFENGFASTLLNMQDQFNCKVISQIDNTSTVKDVRCFGKKHRPDMALDENVVGIELKYVRYAGLKDAIGQGYLYRLRYKFVFLVLIISKDRSAIYEDLHLGKEKDLEDTLQHLADTMNIFTYIVPAFTTKPGIRKCYGFFEPVNA
ncbi:hypothetical protein EZI54_05910 [Marinobacter halodurans]|uniref:Uncharacterized protein n=1 Tax=Marinobacter halodurans TaxID=2528979 RepID=A0ABY1ZQD4_9GAMM|nr:hypothetical protein [Marinobacter halodurans]TBW57983.1 hypothetical protein EZI54_05910 [Marinobacter halodurans]